MLIMQVVYRVDASSRLVSQSATCMPRSADNDAIPVMHVTTMRLGLKRLSVRLTRPFGQPSWPVTRARTATNEGVMEDAIRKDVKPVLLKDDTS